MPGYKALDITIFGAHQELVDIVAREMGQIDIRVHSADINRPQKPEDITERNWTTS